jgi:hypothetical protein
MSFRAQIIDGKIDFKNPALASKFQEWKRAHDGSYISIDLDNPKRSSTQNNYYWTYLGVIAQDTGDTANDLHEFFKRKLLPPQFIKVRGEEMKIPASTTDLDKGQFTEYLDRICALTNIPLPDPIAAGYLPH